MQILTLLKRPTRNYHWSTIQIKIPIIKNKLKKYLRKYLTLTKFWAIHKKDKISINMAKNSSKMEEDHKVAVVVANITTNLMISEALMTFSKNFSVVEIHLLTFLMKMTISSLVDLDEEEWWETDSRVDSEEVSVGVWIKINNKRNRGGTEILSPTSEWWDLDSTMTMTFSEEDSEEVSEEALEEVLDKGDSLHSNPAASEEWEAEWENLLVSRQ